MSRGRRVSPGEKALIISDAVQTDARTAAAKWDVAPTSVSQWAIEFGGLRALRTIYKERTKRVTVHPGVLIARELDRRFDRLSNAHLVRLALQVLEGPAAPGRPNRRQLSKRKGQKGRIGSPVRGT